MTSETYFWRMVSYMLAIVLFVMFLSMTGDQIKMMLELKRIRSEKCSSP